MKLKGASLASVMGATLATKRSSAERLKEGVDPNALVVEPYANPFRTYPLVNDYEKFKKLVAEKNVACYIINTGDFMGKKVQKEDTLGILEAVVEGRAEFKPWGPFSDIEIMEWDGFVPDLTDKGYVAQMQARMHDCIHIEFWEFVAAHEMLVGGSVRVDLPHRPCLDRFRVHVPPEHCEHSYRRQRQRQQRYKYEQDHPDNYVFSLHRCSFPFF